MRQELASITLLDALQVDDRPAFVLDVSLPPAPDEPLRPVYINPSLAAHDELLKTFTNTHNAEQYVQNMQEPYSRFKNWLLCPANEGNGVKGSAHMYGGFVWSATTVNQYRILHGSESAISEQISATISSKQPHLALPTDPREHKGPKHAPQFGKAPSVLFDTSVDEASLNASTSGSVQSSFDFTLDIPPVDVSAHIYYFRSIDWSKTPLGDMRTWAPQLRSVVNSMMRDKSPAVLFWGPEVTMVYNEAYIEIIGGFHPCMGVSARVAAKDYWLLFQPLVDYINITGETVNEHDMPLFVDRHGFLEETYFSFRFIPILNESGHVAGYYQPLLETTKNNILKRRVSCLVEVGSQIAKARNLDHYWDLVLNTLVLNDKDVPFALLYGTETGDSSEYTSISSPGSINELESFVLKGSIAVMVDHPIAPSRISLKTNSHIFASHLLQAAKSRRPVYLPFDDLSMPEEMLANIDWKGYQEPCRAVIISPVLPTTGEQLQGFLILGVNPRRPFDDDYEQFIHVINRLLATSLASVVLFNEEIRQRENAIGQAAKFQEQLLAELKLNEKKFQRFAERSDVAIFITDMNGKYTYRNERWFDIFKIAVDQDDLAAAWNNIVFPEDHAYCERLFQKLVVDHTPITFELRTTMRWNAPDNMDASNTDHEHFVWILCSAYPEVGQNDELKEIVGNVTDISKQKWAEGMQRIRMDSALESKRQLENFIDTTSHEMRNPLSAIMQCADGIISSFEEIQDDAQTSFPIAYSNFLDQVVDSARTISQCTMHMKRIVDDILTISKLDSGLLVITPIDTQPESVAHHAFKMFESEAKASGVEMRFTVESSFRDFHVDWVSLDPTRMLQVLINLITNAVKFTRLESVREVTVSIAASNSEPQSVPNGVEFVHPRLSAEDAHLKEDWKRGETCYLQFSVADTGRGLTDDEKAGLFARFSQGSPRTHINYGGSGLGLFISRRLTEMQGGAIGLASEYKKGSTFSFYVKARRSFPTIKRRESMPPDHPEDIRHRPHTHKEIDKLLNPGRPSMTRRQTAMHPNIPAEVLGHSTESDFEELRRAKSIPEELHVLVVEDNLVNQKVLARQLRNLGCIVSVANHGVEALDHLKKTRYWRQQTSYFPTVSKDSFITSPVELSVILMDWEMPVMNGLIAATRIREFERDQMLTMHIPIIGVTANVREQQIKTAMDAGMDDVVGKPFRVQELLIRMKDVVAGIAQENLGSAREDAG
ncbi:hypothetical protein EJ04DRAFT_537938 [Polyplosphaeria fusca]|uniref:Uncharacterized protein n=1 Tax=Polyplosphaeria fusca TaxID=682080 RepID=A0A9P4UXQ9_9PLEO|nr:hypothetical protein EJ04DRAFT_537938 [Polyplosphaeria fusca]